MSSTHSSIIQRERKKYAKAGWVTFTEFRYQHFLFDLVAFNPKTKELEIIEVDVAHETPKEKLEAAKKIGKVKVFRPFAGLKRTKISPKKTQQILNALASPIRIAILEILYDHEMRFTDLASKLGMQLSRDAGRFNYHLGILKKNKLITQSETLKWQISSKGQKILDFVRKLDKL